MEVFLDWVLTSTFAVLLAAAILLNWQGLKRIFNNYRIDLHTQLEGLVGRGSKEGATSTQLRNRKDPIFQPSPSFKSWWSDEELFQLERRAIFSKTWLFMSHTSRFQKAGDYRTFDVAGFSIIVILGKDRKIRTFQNVCRHRAYQVTKKEYGSSTVLGCRYHGWSYDTTGKLIKAPEFESVPDFDKSINGLWEVQTEVKSGMIFINLDAGKNSAKLDLRNPERIWKTWLSDSLRCVDEWKIEGHFNWKLAGDFSDIQNPTNGTQSSLLLFNRSKKGAKSVRGGWTTVFRQTESGLVTLRYLPRSATETVIECCFYNTSVANKDVSLELKSLKEAIHWEAKQLQYKQQNVLRDVSDELIIQQRDLRAMLKAHAETERLQGEEIHPAARRQNVTAEGNADDAFCRKLASLDGGSESMCGKSARGLLDW